MKALVYHDPKMVAIDKVPDAKLETGPISSSSSPQRISAVRIFISMRDVTDVGKVKILGHENLGVLAEVGKATDIPKKGDKVVWPFNFSCGFCANCERGLSGYSPSCAHPSVMPRMAGAAYGFAGMGPYAEG